MNGTARLAKGIGLAPRLVLLLTLLLAAFGAYVAWAFTAEAQRREHEALQRLSHGLARHIVAHWPQVAPAGGAGPGAAEQAERAERQEVLAHLMVANPGVQAFVLDADGRVREYLGEPGMVREHQVDLAVVRAFLAGAALPLRGTDPMGGGQRRLFSAAMFPPRPGDARPPGYLYLVLDGTARQQVAAALDSAPLWRTAGGAALAGLAAAVVIGAWALRRLTGPLHRLARRMRDEPADGRGGADAGQRAHADARQRAHALGDEVATLNAAFDEMTGRLQAQARQEREQDAAHREAMAGLAHDLRTPLTALHGQLEALDTADPLAHARLRRAALAQSEQVRRLTQQLFELATLQAARALPQRERFRLDELVADTVQKFEGGAGPAAVALGGEAPGRVEVNGDLQLVERALSNLIDNARRHGAAAVRVSLARQGQQAQVVVEDAGPGLPEELHRRLLVGQSLREPPLRRRSGGIGGLGLAIAQRVAQLHGGSLRPLPAPGGGTRLCLALPVSG